jgi:hypothetical protein
MPFLNPDIPGFKTSTQNQIWFETGHSKVVPEFPYSIADNSQHLN